MTAIAFESALMALANRLVAQVRDGEPISLTAEQATAVATAILERAHMLWPERCGGAGWRPPAVLDLRRAGVLGRDYPALDRWRRLVLGDRSHRTPLERAAAWELEALACDVAGDPYLAHRARLAAAHDLPAQSDQPHQHGIHEPDNRSPKEKSSAWERALRRSMV